jgi:sec-independent protein translocase protein TatC
LALVCGILLAVPVIFWQIWAFVVPGLYKHEKRVLVPFTLLSSLCFLGGALFGYFVVFPPAFRFLVGYTTEYLSPLPAVKEYFSLSLRLLIAFGVIFELPIFMVLLAKMGIVTVSFPLLVLYEISIVAVWIFGRKPFAGFDKEGPVEEGAG